MSQVCLWISLAQIYSNSLLRTVKIKWVIWQLSYWMGNYVGEGYKSTKNVSFYMSYLPEMIHRFAAIFVSLPGSCHPLCASSNCEQIKSKQNSGSMPVASGQTVLKQSSTKHCVSFFDIFLLSHGFLNSSIAKKVIWNFTLSLTAGMRMPNNKKLKKRSIVKINWALGQT